MHRRKTDSVAQNRRDGWGRGISKRGGLFAKRGSLTNTDETSATEPTSATSSVLDFGLPVWEKPQDAVSREKYDNITSPKELPKEDDAVGYQMPKLLSGPKSPVRLKTASQSSPFRRRVQHLEATDELTDMVVTLNGSFNSIDDDITFVSTMEHEEQQKGQKRVHSPRKRNDPQDHRAARNHTSHLIPTAPCLVHDSPPKKNFVWKKGTNGRYMKVPLHENNVPETTQSPRSPIQPEPQKDPREEKLQRMEEEMLNKALELSKHQKGVLLQGRSTSTNGGALLHSSRQDLRSPASVPSAPSRSRFGTPAELNGQEDSLLHMAMERSMHDPSRNTALGSDPLASSSNHTRRHRNGSVEDDGIDRSSLYATAGVFRANEPRSQNHVLYLGGEKSVPATNDNPNTRAGVLAQALFSPETIQELRMEKGTQQPIYQVLDRDGSARRRPRSETIQQERGTKGP